MIHGIPPSSVTIEEWGPQQARYSELLDFIRAQGQEDWVNFSADWHRSSHVLVALRGSALAGFLRFVIQEIGPDMDCPPVQLKGEILLEAKVLAFAVEGAQRRQGIGRKLQEAVIGEARARGCYQVRSHSGGDEAANRQLKLTMGYGVHPIVRGGDARGAYFILPLAAGEMDQQRLDGEA